MARKVLKRTSGKLAAAAKRRSRIRSKISGTAERPRLCVTRTNRTLFVQLIDDDKGATLLALATPKKKVANVKLATELGKEVATKAKSLGIAACTFDRGSRVYHGRIAAVAAGAREAGLAF